MNRARPFLADLDPGDVLAAQEHFFSSPQSREVFIVSGSLCAAIVLAVAGAVIYSKSKKRKRPHRRHSTYDSAQAQLEANAKSGDSRKHGRRRRTPRPMNPTLAETGGLPPIRETKP